MSRAKSKIIEEHGIRIRLFERGGVIYRDVVVGRVVSANGKPRTKHHIKSLRHGDWKRAEMQMRRLAFKIAQARFTGEEADSAPVTIGRVFEAYRQHHMPTLSRARQREAEARIEMFTEAWGADLQVSDIDATRVRLYCQKRRSLEIVAPGLRPDVDGKRRKGYRKPKPVRDGALDAEFRWLNSVLNFACDFMVNGKPLLPKNPIPTNSRRRRAWGWPVEKNPLQPVASHQRFVKTMEYVDVVDPVGRLRCILALARYTGRRESAICQLRANDLLLTQDRIRAALAGAGMDERLVKHMPYGAIRWREDADKMGFLFIAPLGPNAREEIDAYLRKNPRMGDVPLFPAPGPRRKKGTPPPRESEKPISRETAAKWLVKAERLAGLPKMMGGVFHPYRRLFATERKNLPDIDVATAGGWKSPQAMRRSYQKATPDGVLAAVIAT